MILISISSFIVFYFNGLGLAYNDARSHLDIGRRVVEGLKPGLAQLGSVWLPLPHILITLTVWNDFMWHSGLAGALVSMISYVITGALIYKFLEKINVGMLGRLIGVAVFALNTNILYLQSTAMTESLLLVTMTAAVFELLLWYQDNKILNLVKAAFFIMLSTLVRYDGWFLFLFGFNYLKEKRKLIEASLFGIAALNLIQYSMFGDPYRVGIVDFCKCLRIREARGRWCETPLVGHKLSPLHRRLRTF